MTSAPGEFTSQQEPVKKSKPKKTKTTFTGVAAIGEIDDIEDLDTNAVKAYLEGEALVKKDQKDWQWRPLDEKITCVKSLYLFGKDTKTSTEKWSWDISFRRLCFNVQKHKQFDRIIMLLIFLSSLKLATDTYMTSEDFPEDHIVLLVSEQVDSFFTWVFFAESMIKIVALGFIMD